MNGSGWIQLLVYVGLLIAITKPMGIRPAIVAYQGNIEAGGVVRTSHQSLQARLGAANAKPMILSSGWRG